MQRTKIRCELCGQEISKSNLSKHLRRHEVHPETFITKDNNITCEFCGKVCKNRNSYAQHKIRCRYNTNRINVYHDNFNTFGHVAWNKGLTKETNESVRLTGKNVSKTLHEKISNGWKPYFATNDYWTLEKRLQLSETKKQFYKEHPEKHPNRIVCDRNRRTYIEQVAYDWLVENKIEFKEQYQTEFNGSLRFVDFYVPRYNLFIELDGVYWHTYSKDLDKEKDIYAQNNYSISTLRITSDEDIIQKLQDYFVGVV